MDSHPSAPHPSAPRPLARPAPDPRARGLVPDFAAMQDLIAGLVPPDRASMDVMSTLETVRELVRHSYHRYEFATAAVTHSLLALEHVLVDRLATERPLRELLDRAVRAGLVTTDRAAVLDRALLLRDRLARGAATSAAVHPAGAVELLRAVFDTVAMLLGPPPTAGAAAPDTGAAGSADRLALLWEEHRRAPYPDSFRGVDIAGVELILLDADVAGLVRRELDGGLDADRTAALWRYITELDRVVPLIDEAYCRAYFAKLRTVAALAAARHLPPAA
ncbi:hypothetical protein AB0442_13980 [Kitasatospora sp. NPDC085895]|uniref:hypothetical protein n=1 Tax=Kitasatospora sp. NPDC085895 TaxID=3155057 RepID=UPI00344F92D8